MIVVYDKSTRQIVGHCGTIVDTGKSREATVAELFPDRDASTLDAVYLKDDPRFLITGVESYRLAQDQNGIVTGIEHVPRINLSCDAKDTDGDGIPDIPAKTDASTTITATLGSPGIAVTFQTTHGTLSDRSVTTDKSGKVTVSLRASAETVPALVTATAPNFLPGTLAVEFRPATGFTL
jgi:hypothetical protein